MVDVVGTFQEDIIKAFAGTLSVQQMTVLVNMHEETRMLQLAIAEQQKQFVQLVEAMKLSQEAMKYYKDQFAKFEKKFGDQQNEFVRSEDNKLDG